MESRPVVLKHCVMNAMADDYENLEHIIGWATKSMSERGIQASRDELVEILRQMIDDGDAQAYILSPEPPYATPVSFSASELADLWFYLTPKGLDLVGRPVD